MKRTYRVALIALGAGLALMALILWLGIRRHEAGEESMRESGRNMQRLRELTGDRQ